MTFESRGVQFADAVECLRMIWQISERRFWFPINRKPMLVFFP